MPSLAACADDPLLHKSQQQVIEWLAEVQLKTDGLLFPYSGYFEVLADQGGAALPWTVPFYDVRSLQSNHKAVIS